MLRNKQKFLWCLSSERSLLVITGHHQSREEFFIHRSLFPPELLGADPQLSCKKYKQLEPRWKIYSIALLVLVEGEVLQACYIPYKNSLISCYPPPSKLQNLFIFCFKCMSLCESFVKKVYKLYRNQSIVFCHWPT